jgi:hypothetical protein
LSKACLSRLHIYTGTSASGKGWFAAYSLAVHFYLWRITLLQR